ncbi:uncharacterized protein LOC106471617, partial [Limulus polyphemus]|uniref:Uncharacterized protein LOC106471617 n=1 Tax=Limulus polyphemus TaxID=6850 RepID=A0ABM1BSA2_LIMPO
MVNGYQKKLRWASFAICYIIWQLSLPSGMAAHEWELKMIGDACSSDEECADFFSVCANGICSCDTAYRKMHFFSVTACNEERKLGDLCTSDKACTIPHSHCFMNTCVCKSGYIKELLSTQYSCTKYEVENHDITTLETNSSPKFEHLKLGFSKWPFIAAIVVALLILAICIYLCLRRPR